ncbi:FAD-dependent monooxygenase [Nocardia spumae]|uniref:FAD-dependent monooxygenase n=1 Tax=Nocardia spumae TaxID=2887190 RepID=UPI001D136177|nr:FAD-dependent monooxygenase [Nocardia spumae]
MSTISVLIAGAGPTGLTLAIDLARRGIAVRVADKAETPFSGSRGDGIQPRTLEVFDDLGVLDAILAAATPPPLMRIHIGGTLATADGTETVIADHLVGADGGASTVRRALGIAFEGTTDESLRMLLGDVTADGLDHDFGYWFAPADAPTEGIALTPLPGGALFQFAAPLGQAAEPSRELLQGYVDRMSGRTGITIGEPIWSTLWRPNIRLARHFRAGRVLLAGDAAHAHPPTGGQGMNTGIQDAYNLGWKLAAALDGDERPLGTYESERRGVAQRVLGLSAELLDKHLDGREAALERGPETHQLGISYRAPADTGVLTAGDRAPDAPPHRADGSSVRLFDLFRDPHATHLSFGTPDHSVEGAGLRAYSIVAPGTPAEPDQLVATGGHAFADYAATDGTRVLVRPDGYPAWHRQG